MFYHLRGENISHTVSAVGTKKEAISTQGETEGWQLQHSFSNLGYSTYGSSLGILLPCLWRTYNCFIIRPVLTCLLSLNCVIGNLFSWRVPFNFNRVGEGVQYSK